MDVSESTASSGLVTDSQKDVGRKKGMIRSLPSGLPRDADDSDFDLSLHACFGQSLVLHSLGSSVAADSVAAVPARRSRLFRQVTASPTMVHPVGSMRVRSRVSASATRLGMTSVPHLGENVLLALVKVTE